VKYWVNIDKPTKSFLHTDICPEVVREATPLKGINEERKDGGWFSFATTKEARDSFAKRYPNKTLFSHACVGSHSE
jgi:hypothetical protein